MLLPLDLMVEVSFPLSLSHGLQGYQMVLKNQETWKYIYLKDQPYCCYLFVTLETPFIWLLQLCGCIPCKSRVRWAPLESEGCHQHCTLFPSAGDDTASLKMTSCLRCYLLQAECVNTSLMLNMYIQEC